MPCSAFDRTRNATRIPATKNSADGSVVQLSKTKTWIFRTSEFPKEKKKLASKASTTTMTSTWEKACHGAVARQNGEALMESPFPPSFSVHFWKWGWLGLNNTQEKVVALSSGGSTGSGCGVSFMRCSVQARMACWSRQNRVFLLRGCYHVSMMLWISSLGMVFLSCSQANVSRSRAFPWLRLQVRNSTAFMILSAAC